MVGLLETTGVTLARPVYPPPPCFSCQSKLLLFVQLYQSVEVNTENKASWTSRVKVEKLEGRRGSLGGRNSGILTVPSPRSWESRV